MSTPPFDTAKPNVARMYDYWLGGTDNFEADREAAEAVRRIRPNVAEQALGNKRFLTRAVTYVAGHGVRQFLDVGSGLPTSPVRAPGAEPQWLATHEAARRVMPEAIVAYVDHDPAAVQHSQALLGDDLHGVAATVGDMRDPKAILADDEIRAAGFDLDAPACVVLACVLHFVDAETAHNIASTFARALAPGSYLVITVGFGRGREGPHFGQHVQRPGRPTDLLPHVGADHRPVRRAGTDAARHRAGLGLAARPAGNRAGGTGQHDRRRRRPPPVTSSPALTALFRASPALCRRAVA